MINFEIIRSFIRWLISLLSLPFNKKLSKIKQKEKKLLLFLSNKAIKLKSNSNFKNLKNTHKIFGKKILDLIINKNLRSFLRYPFIQKVFFVHNRFFIKNELNQLKEDKSRWQFWKKLLEEDQIGNPIRYFLYPQSSGNRIRQTFHLKKFTDFSKKDLRKYDVIFEIGGGYGNMARLFNKINKNSKYIILETPEVNLLQYYYIKCNNLKVSFGYKSSSNIFLISEIDKIKKNLNMLRNKKNKLLIANWSLSETPLNFRYKMNFIFKFFSDYLISFQDKFENIDNLKYFNTLKNKLQKKYNYKSEIVKINSMNKFNLTSGINHYYLFSKSRYE